MASGSDVSETVFHFLPIKKVMLIKNENGREQFIYLKEITLKLTRLLEFLQLAFVALVDPSCYFSHLPIAWSLVLKGLWKKKGTITCFSCVPFVFSARFDSRTNAIKRRIPRNKCTGDLHSGRNSSRRRKLNFHKSVEKDSK